MNIETSAELVHDALMLALVLAIPCLAVGFIAALATGLLQSMSQIQDQTLSVVPRLLVGLIAAVLLLPWMLDRLTTYTIELYQGVAATL